MFHSAPRRLVYTRHPRCRHNVEHEKALLEGIPNKESPLVEVGELQCTITADYLKREFPSITGVFCSTFSRTRAIPVAAGFEPVMIQTSLLDERNMGVWHTHIREKVLKMHPGEEQRLEEVGYYAYQAPLGESCADVEARLATLLNSGMLGGAEETTYLSGHGIAGLCLRRILTGATVEEWHSWDRMKNASVTVFEREANGMYACTMYNHVPWEGLIDPELLQRKSVEA